jgi:lipid II:glycine glycyltransferase (peptidoglycan interpeptide bridge formation enzyme)
VVGVLPAAELSSILYRRRLVSQPFSEYGGILLDPSLTADEVDAALVSLRDFIRHNAAAFVMEIHGNHGMDPPPESLLETGEAVGQIAVMALTSDTTALWENVVRYSVRKAVKQARNFGVTVAFGCDPTILRQDFFPLYLKSMKRLGVPPHKLAYYTRSLEEFGDTMVLATARADNGVPIAALLGFSCGGRVSIINTVSDPDYWHFKANDLLHWEMIKRTGETGGRFFDFGSVRYDGQSTYKKKWGTAFADHCNYLLTAEARSARPMMINSSSGAMKTLSRLWSTYVPERVGRFIGPLIRRQLAR